MLRDVLADSTLCTVHVMFLNKTPMGSDAQLAVNTTRRITAKRANLIAVVYKFTMTYKNGKVGQGDLVFSL